MVDDLQPTYHFLLSLRVEVPHQQRHHIRPVLQQPVPHIIGQLSVGRAQGPHHRSPDTVILKKRRTVLMAFMHEGIMPAARGGQRLLQWLQSGIGHIGQNPALPCRGSRLCSAFRVPREALRKNRHHLPGHAHCPLGAADCVHQGDGIQQNALLAIRPPASRGNQAAAQFSHFRKNRGSLLQGSHRFHCPLQPEILRQQIGSGNHRRAQAVTQFINRCNIHVSYLSSFQFHVFQEITPRNFACSQRPPGLCTLSFLPGDFQAYAKFRFFQGHPGLWNPRLPVGRPPGYPLNTTTAPRYVPSRCSAAAASACAGARHNRRPPGAPGLSEGRSPAAGKSAPPMARFPARPPA